MKRIMRALPGAVIAVALPAAAFAQATLLQGGAWTPGHAPIYSGGGSSQPVVTDSGPAGGGGAGLGLSEILQVGRPGNGVNTPPYANSGTGQLNAHNCFYDAPTTSAAGYHFLCFDANAQGGGLIAYGSGGAATPGQLQLNVNGTTYQFPFTGTGGGNVVGPPSAVGNTVSCFDGATGRLLKSCSQQVQVPTFATAAGTANTLTLTPAFLPGGVSAATDGMRLRFVMPYTPTARGILTSVVGLSGSSYLGQSDGQTLLAAQDLTAGQTVTIEWMSSASRWVVVSAPLGGMENFIAKAFEHGQYKLQASTSSVLLLGSADGGGNLGYDTTAQGYRMVQFGPGGACSANVNTSTNPVNGVANQHLTVNTPYLAMLEPQAGGDSSDPAAPTGPCLSFWAATSTTYQVDDGNQWGLFTLKNSGITDPTRLYVGLIYCRNSAGVCDISNIITPGAAIGNAVFSHSTLTRWKFGYQTTAVSNTTTAGAAAAVFTTPSISFPTEGIDSSPSFISSGTVSCVGAATATIELFISGTTTIGGSQSGTSVPDPLSFTVAAGATVPWTVAWESAPPAGFYTAQLKGSSTGNNCTFNGGILGHIAQ